jgi:hypothetical protein
MTESVAPFDQLRTGFDKLRANGPFVVSVSNHERPTRALRFFGHS